MADGWTVCIIATPTAASWLDRSALQEQTGYPVRVEWRMPGDPEPHPPADVLLVVPVTFNTVNKWAVGASDTLALGILNEALGTGLPIHAFPRVKATLAAHPAYAGHLAVARGAGVSSTTAASSGPGEEMGRPLGDRRRHAAANRPPVRVRHQRGRPDDMRATYTAPPRSGFNG